MLSFNIMSELSNYNYILNIIKDIEILVDIGNGIYIDEKKEPTYLHNNNIRVPKNLFQNIKCEIFRELNEKFKKEDKDAIIVDIGIDQIITTMEKTLKILIIAILWYKKVNITIDLVNSIYNKLINLPSLLDEIRENENIKEYYKEKCKSYKEFVFYKNNNTYDEGAYIEFKNLIQRYKAILTPNRVNNRPVNNKPVNKDIKPEIIEFIKKYIECIKAYNDNQANIFDTYKIIKKFDIPIKNYSLLTNDDLINGLDYINDLFEESNYTPDKFINNIFSTKIQLNQDNMQMKFLIHLIDKIYLLMGRDISKNYTLQKGRIKGSSWFLVRTNIPVRDDNLLGYLFYINGFLLGRWLKPSDYANGKFLINSLKKTEMNINSNNNKYSNEINKRTINRKNRTYNQGYMTNFETDKKLIRNTP